MHMRFGFLFPTILWRCFKNIIIELIFATCNRSQKNKNKKNSSSYPLYQNLDIFSIFLLWKWKMLSVSREAKISGHCLKPVFVFHFKDENWLTRHIHIDGCRYIHFFQWSCISELQFFKVKWEKLSCFCFPMYRYLWTQDHPLIMLGIILGIKLKYGLSTG